MGACFPERWRGGGIRGNKVQLHLKPRWPTPHCYGGVIICGTTIVPGITTTSFFSVLFSFFIDFFFIILFVCLFVCFAFLVQLSRIIL